MTTEEQNSTSLWLHQVALEDGEKQRLVTSFPDQLSPTTVCSETLKLSPRTESSIFVPPLFETAFKENDNQTAPQNHNNHLYDPSAAPKAAKTEELIVSTFHKMKNRKGKIDKSPDADPDDDMRSIIEETSSELKSLDFNSSGRGQKNKIRSRRSSKARASDTSNDTEERDNTRKNSNQTGIDEEDKSTSPLTHRDGEGEEVANSNDNSSNGESNSRTQEINSRETKLQEFEVKLREFIKVARRKCGVFVNNDRVQLIMISFILINAIMMGMGTFPFIKDDEVLRESFETTDKVFLVIFTIELAMQFTYHGFQMFSDGWLLFDFIIIILSWILDEYQIVRAFRIFRAFRLVTRVKLMKDLILALFGVMPRMAAIAMMLLLIFYIFAVMFTQIFSDAYEGEDGVLSEDYFGTLADSLLTLFQIMTMDEWAQIVRELQRDYPRIRFALVVYLVMTGFIVVNLIVAVICDAISTLDDDDKAKFYGKNTHDEDNDSESDGIELRDQLDEIEDQIGNLTRIQARTFHTLEYLAVQLKIQKENRDANEASAAVTKTSSEDSSDDHQGKPPGSVRDLRALLKKERSGERSRREGFAQAGYKSKRKNYTDTWTQEGSDKTLRKTMIANFAKSARELQKMRENMEAGTMGDSD